MTEKQYQTFLIKEYEDLGYYVIKLITTNRNGIPDLLCMKPNEIIFIEVKSDKGKLTELQKFRHSELRQKGFKVMVLFAQKILS